jgi:hypothetical protein
MNAIQQLSRQITRRLTPDLPAFDARRRAIRARFRGVVTRGVSRPVPKTRPLG